jgi:cysteine-rich repeat protein
MLRSLLLALLSLALGACSDLRTHDAPGGIVIYDAGAGTGGVGLDGGLVRQTRPVMQGEIAPIYGFVSPEAMVEYYYLGEVEVDASGQAPVNPIFFYYDEAGEPLFRLAEDGTRLVGWHPTVPTVPTRAGYSPFWRVHHVRVKGTVDRLALESLRKTPADSEVCQMDATCGDGKRCVENRCRDPFKIGIFELDGIKSVETLEKSKLPIWATETILNCPVVDADAKLLKGLADPDRPFPKVQVWFERLKAYCYLMEGGREILGAGAESLPPGKPPTAAKAYFLQQQLSFGSDEKITVLPRRAMVLTESLPGSPGYSPLVKEIGVVVDKDYRFKDLRSVAELKQKGLPLAEKNSFHNLPVRGLIPACLTDDECAATGGKIDPPLKCSIEQGYCSPPFARLHEECRRGVKECDPKGGPGGSRLACVGLLAREKYFCLHACDSAQKDENPDKDLDTRCGSVQGYRCYPLRQSDPTRPNGVCIRICNSRAGDQAALLAECESPTCGNGKLEHGETCDDGNRADGDGCNQFCSLSTFDRCDKGSDCKGSGQSCKEPVLGQGMSYCLPPAQKEKDESVENGKYRTACMEFDYCWPPDDRAEWLGKKEEVKP